MIKKNIFYLIILLCSCGCNENPKSKVHIPEVIPNTLISYDKAIFKIDTAYVENKRFSGYLFSIDQTSNDTISKIAYIDGLMNGICKIWYPKNHLMEEREYKNGAKHGHQIAYWENGKKKFEFTALNDTYEGELREWNVKGDLIHLATFKNGQEEGPQKMWYDNGKIRANYVIRNGKRYGLLGTKNCVNVSDSIFVVK